MTCVICGGSPQRWCRKLDRDVYRCRGCGHVSVPAGLARDEKGVSIYESDDPIFSAAGNADYYFGETNVEAARDKLAFVTRFAAKGGRLLDVGASFGHFLAEARNRFDAKGIEVSPSSVAWARRNLAVDIAVGSIYELGDQYDVITSWDVIEHLEDPAAAVDRLRCALKPRGMLFLSTPDAGALIARLMGPRWHYLDPVQHLNLFSRENLTRLLASRGFRLAGYTYFGRAYRIDYIVNRLRYLLSSSSARELHVPFGRVTVPIKLWDVMGLAFERDAATE